MRTTGMHGNHSPNRNKHQIHIVGFIPQKKRNISKYGTDPTKNKRRRRKKKIKNKQTKKTIRQ